MREQNPSIAALFRKQGSRAGPETCLWDTSGKTSRSMTSPQNNMGHNRTDYAVIIPQYVQRWLRRMFTTIEHTHTCLTFSIRLEVFVENCIRAIKLFRCWRNTTQNDSQSCVTRPTCLSGQGKNKFKGYNDHIREIYILPLPGVRRSTHLVHRHACKSCHMRCERSVCS